MAMFRPFIAVSLALVIALTSGVMAVARGQTNAAGSIVLCTGTGPIAVQVDADGQPVGPAHVCPDCALGLFDAAAGAPPTMLLPLVAVATDPALSPDTAVAFLLPCTPRARAPPLA